jgi:hypothetical protein
LGKAYLLSWRILINANEKTVLAKNGFYGQSLISK